MWFYIPSSYFCNVLWAFVIHLKVWWADMILEKGWVVEEEDVLGTIVRVKEWPLRREQNGEVRGLWGCC